jgi:hypothetical protein
LSGAVSRVLSPAWVTPRGVVIIPLGVPLPTPSSGQPGSFGRAALERSSIRPCTSWGLPGRPRHRGRRCALTAPFQPHRRAARPGLAVAVPRIAGIAAARNRKWKNHLAVCPLLHFPPGCPDRELPGSLPCGARTFLERRQKAPPRSPGYHRPPQTMPRPRRDQASVEGSRKRPQLRQVCTRWWPSISLTTWLGAP